MRFVIPASLQIFKFRSIEVILKDWLAFWMSGMFDDYACTLAG
jgi:hypothetical protein